jgi:hypothetical protein
LKRFALAETSELPALGVIIEGYIQREVTYPEDVQDGFAGPALISTKIFPSGLLSGIPVIFFDILLLWSPMDK